MSQLQVSGANRCKHCGQFKNWIDEHMCPSRTKNLPDSFTPEYAIKYVEHRFLKVVEKHGKNLFKKWKKEQSLKQL